MTSSEANLRLLFTVVENASSQTVRSNCTIALGDLAVRFPNLVEPWTEHMYARLRDSSVSVRINAILVLSHLILNEMMKVCMNNYLTYFCISMEFDNLHCIIRSRVIYMKWLLDWRMKMKEFQTWQSSLLS